MTLRLHEGPLDANGLGSTMVAVQDVYGADANKWIVYWRLFYIACSELFNYNGGEEWGAHRHAPPCSF